MSIIFYPPDSGNTNKAEPYHAQEGNTTWADWVEEPEFEQLRDIEVNLDPALALRGFTFRPRREIKLMATPARG